jgi:hypothetical protein
MIKNLDTHSLGVCVDQFKTKAKLRTKPRSRPKTKRKTKQKNKIKVTIWQHNRQTTQEGRHFVK